MATSIKVPELGDSVLEATIIRWVKQEGDFVKLGETVVELETEKANFEVASELTGVLTKISRNTEEDVEVGDVLGEIEPSKDQKVEDNRVKDNRETTDSSKTPTRQNADVIKIERNETEIKATPVAKNIAEQNKVDLAEVEATGIGNKITKEDVKSHIDSRQKKKPESTEISDLPSDLFPSLSKINSNRENRVKMSRRRRTIARRLKEAQETAAILSTFNEVDMSAVMEIRKRRKEEFKEKHGVNLGFSSFFVKACIGALKSFPQINAEIQDEEIVFKNYFDIGVAIGAEEGLVVPVLRDADRKSFADIEKEIKEFAVKSNEGTLSLDELMGGTFSITNGGVFGSLMSTPIINPPQVGILGLHKIEQRPVVKDDEIVIRPMMYTALSYDHRIVDGREAVQFLVKIKELIEDPESLLIEG
ncbi:MAG: 2-oxoglutarate dehydrogenase complex dihydrolipoyllysine-residue succinyltransferase [Thermodesulfobacteriota bacterium]